MVLSEPCVVCVSSVCFWPACFSSLGSDAWNFAIWGRHPHLAQLVCTLNTSDPFPGVIHHNRSDYIWSWWSLLVPDSSVFSRQTFFLIPFSEEGLYMLYRGFFACWEGSFYLDSCYNMGTWEKQDEESASWILKFTIILWNFIDSLGLWNLC